MEEEANKETSVKQAASNASSWTLKMEAVSSSQTSVDFQRRNLLLPSLVSKSKPSKIPIGSQKQAQHLLHRYLLLCLLDLIIHPEDSDDIFFRNIDKLLPGYAKSHATIHV
jgi:hypothetical protein